MRQTKRWYIHSCKENAIKLFAPQNTNFFYQKKLYITGNTHDVFAANVSQAMV
jgi:hypothetical protein